MKNTEIENTVIPDGEAENEVAAEKETTPNEAEKIFVPVKFNKEIRNLELEEAAALAQKGLKFDAIAKDYESLKRIAAQNGNSISGFLCELEQSINEKRKKDLAEKCGGNEEIAEYVMKLENGTKNDTGFEELKREFPELADISDLPDEVIENSKLKGTLLLDEYLRYLHNENKKAADAAVLQKNIADSSIGSQTDCKGGTDPETAEFLKGLWR